MLAVEMDLQARPRRVLPRADRAEEYLAVRVEAGAGAAKDVAGHRRRAVPGPRKVTADPAVLGSEKVVTRPKVVAFVAGEEPQVPALGYHGRFASSLGSPFCVGRMRPRGRTPGVPNSLGSLRGRPPYSKSVSRATSRLAWHSTCRHVARAMPGRRKTGGGDNLEALRRRRGDDKETFVGEDGGSRRPLAAWSSFGRRTRLPR